VGVFGKIVAFGPAFFFYPQRAKTYYFWMQDQGPCLQGQQFVIEVDPLPRHRAAGDS
jgi:hypothetical protein